MSVYSSTCASLIPRNLPSTAILLALILIASVSNLAATTVALLPAEQTTIFSPPAYADNNFGAENLLECGANGVGQPGRALIQFDLGSIPANAVITDAQMTITVTNVPPGDQHAGPANSDFGLYAMLVPWVAGTGGTIKGAPAQLGETTWDERLAGIAGWGQPGGQIGTDFSNSPSTSTSIGTVTGSYTFGVTPQMLSDLQSWLSDPSTNFGYMMISDGESTPGTARRFDATTLEVTYSIPVVPEPSAGLLLITSAWCFASRTARRRRHDLSISK
jgi:hypothetical protein